MATQTHSSLALKGFALGSTLWIGSAMASTSLIFIPALMRPLSTASTTKTPTAQSTSSLQPPLPSTDGRLTPQPDVKGSSPPSVYKLVAQQFVRFDQFAFGAQVPLELLTIAAYGVLAYRSRSTSSALWTHWTGSAAIIAAVFPFTGALMVPFVHKIARIAGDEEKVEPYEDSPLDREAEQRNTAEFLKQWTTLNTVRTAGVLLAGIVGLRALVFE